MKRLFTLQLVIFMAILSVAAQSVTSGQSKVLDAFNPQQLSTTPFQLVKPQIGPDYQFKTSQKSRRANADASTIIRQQPAGTLLDNMITSYGGYTRNWIYGLMDVTTDGGVGKIVEGEDGNIYIFNLPTNLSADSWVKAERGEGDTIVIHRQLIDQREGSDAVYDYYLTKLVWEYTDKTTGEGRFVEATGDTDIKLLYSNGVLSSIEDNTNPYEEGHYALGAVYTTDGTTFTWEGNTNWNLHFEALTETKIVLPEGANLETITVDYINANGTPTSEQVKVAFVGNDVYLNVYDAATYIKGTIEGDKLTFKSGQYLGIYASMYHLFFTGQQYYTVTDEGTGQEYETAKVIDELVFDYDAETRSFSTGDAFVINVGKKTARLYLTALRAPKFYFYEETPATPADPVITNYNATYNQWGYNALQFTIQATDVNGGFIVPEKLSWQAYVDDEPLIFSPDDYSGLTQEMVEIPYGWYDPSYDIYTSFFTLYFEPAKNVGIQTIYRGAGEERRSHIVYYDITTGQIEKVDPSGGTAAIQSAANQSNTERISYFDAAGRQVSNKTKGLVIKQITTADGVRRSKTIFRK